MGGSKAQPRQRRRNPMRALYSTLMVLPACVLGFVSLPHGTFRIKYLVTVSPVKSKSAIGRLNVIAYSSPMRTKEVNLSGATVGAGADLSLAMENAKKLEEDELGNFDFVAGPGEDVRRLGILDRAYKECERITGIFAKTFYLGTKFMSPVARNAVWAIYVWCRRTDDIVDGPRAMMRGMLSMEEELKDWTKRLEDVWRGKPRDALDLALVDVKAKYPTLDIAPFKDMIDGMLMDVPGAGKTRYQNFAELELYCYRVAGTVGLMTLPILGAAEGYTEEQAKEPALALGVALQLTNILRDVGEDSVRGRIYLPLDDMKRFGVTEQKLMDGVVNENYREFMRYQIARARFYYRKAQAGIPMLAPDSRLPVQASLDMYSKILNAIEANDYDNFRRRAYVSKTEKLMTLPLSWWRANYGLAEAVKTAKVPQGEEFELTRYDKLSVHANVTA